MTIRRITIAAVAVAAVLSACSGSEPSACDQLDELNRSGDYEALIADADDPDGVLNGCIDELGDIWDDMSPEERAAFLD